MPDPQRVTMFAYLHVVGRFEGAFDEVLEPREAPNALVHRGVFGGHLPNADLAILVAAEDLVTSDYDGLDEPATGLKPRELTLILPHPNVLAVGSSIQELACGSQGVNVALLANKGADEAGGRQGSAVVPWHVVIQAV